MERHRDLLNLVPLGLLGAGETNGTVTFGLWLPWVSATDGNAVTVKIIHEADQFLQGLPAREFRLTASGKSASTAMSLTTGPIRRSPAMAAVLLRSAGRCASSAAWAAGNCATEMRSSRRNCRELFRAKSMLNTARPEK